MKIYEPKISLFSFIENHPGFIQMKCLNSSYISCSKQFLQLTGYGTISEIKGKMDYDMPWENMAAEKAGFYKAGNSSNFSTNNVLNSSL